MQREAHRVITALRLSAHPEGGYFRRVYASFLEVEHGGHRRPAMTAIDFLLEADQCSRWHRVDADEAWHWRQGGPLSLQVFDPDADTLHLHTLGEPADGNAGLHVVRAGQWQRAWVDADFALVACVVAPGFVWEGFALLDAAPDIAARLAALGAGEPR